VKAIMLMFDSLNRHMLEPYGCDWVHTPNFRRLAGKTVTFDNAYVGSMPCMPARRELHTGRYNFLHRSWGPLEPFDDSMPEILKNKGVYTHLTSDHYHYWEEGGCTYHPRYSTWENWRGQEGDPWIGQVADEPPSPNQVYRNADRSRWNAQDRVNRKYTSREEDFPQVKTMSSGIEFIRRNAGQDNWFLHIETFDPHEPYYVPQKYKDLYKDMFTTGKEWDWPPYAEVVEDPALVKQMRACNAALVSMCDHYLGKVLDVMDEKGLWKDTMLIVNTDHGFLLGEHDWWGKMRMPFWNEIARTPLFIWDPRSKKAGQHRASLVQTIDLAPTLLEFFGVPLPKDMQGVPLRETIAADRKVRNAVLFGIHGGHVNVTDGRYVYMRAPAHEENQPLCEYTLMPTHMRHTFAPDEFNGVELADPFAFTKNCKTMKIPCKAGSWIMWQKFGTLLYDLKNDPQQQAPINNEKIEKRMIDLMVKEMRKNDAPEEQYVRLGVRLRCHQNKSNPLL